MDKALHVEYHRNGTKNAWVQYNNTSNYVVIRYADDVWAINSLFEGHGVRTGLR